MTGADVRAAILAADDRPSEAVDVPWETNGEKIYARALSLSSWKRWLVTDGEVNVTAEMMAEIVVESLVTEDGEQIFTAADTEALLEKNAQVIQHICATVLRLSGMSTEVEPDFDRARSGGASSS